MAISDNVKDRALSELQKMHTTDPKRWVERVRILNWSLADFAFIVELAKTAPFFSLAEPVQFDVRSAQRLLDDIDQKIADHYCLRSDDIEVVSVETWGQGGLSVAASVISTDRTEEQIPLIVLIDVNGDITRVKSFGSGKRWHIGRNGSARLRSRKTSDRCPD